ncbi:MAG TPA: ABC transporter ATP-binding protein [Deltaproteobacteria bacterium]|nr:ABC transporter ATP-binding protein [Deltaproteobacteria bacterium]
MIQVRDLTRYYGEFAALQDVSFELKEGEIIGLLGLNGAGKSTTLMILAGLLAPSSGSVQIDGTDLANHPELRARIGFLTESPPLYTEMTVTSFLRHIGRMKGMSNDKINARLPEVIRLADLAGREHQVIGTLSHGYKKRVGIAQAIIHDPKLVILDEPISGLDPAQIVEMRKVVKGLGEKHAVIISSHILSEVSQTCDRILVIGNGRLVAQGTEAELMARSGENARLVITVRGDQAAFTEWLDKSERIVSVVSKDVADGLARALVEMEGDQREDLLLEIAKAGFGLRLVEDPQDELEEIFLGLTHQEAA